MELLFQLQLYAGEGLFELHIPLSLPAAAQPSMAGAARASGVYIDGLQQQPAKRVAHPGSN